MMTKKGANKQNYGNLDIRILVYRLEKRNKNQPAAAINILNKIRHQAE